MALHPHFENFRGSSPRSSGGQMETISELVDATLARYGVYPCGADTPVREVVIASVGVQEPLIAQYPEPLPSGF